MAGNGDHLRRGSAVEAGPVGATGSGVAGVLDQDVGCPACGYNLRGLAEDVATCPECGTRSDVAMLLVRRWDLPWYRAPKYNQLCMPAAAAFVAVLGWLLTGLVSSASMSWESTSMIGWMWLVFGLVGWGSAMAWVYSRLDGATSVGFALLTHFPIAGYIGGLIAFVSGLVMTIVWLGDLAGGPKPKPEILLIGLMLLVGGAAGFVMARWIERMAAKHCIRLYLRRATTS